MPKAELDRRRPLEARVAALEKQIKKAGNDRVAALANSLLPPTIGTVVAAWGLEGHRSQLLQLQAELDALKQSLPPIAYANGVQEGGCPQSPQAGIHDVRVHIRGRYDRLGKLVSRRFPRILAGDNQTPITQGSGRMELARWIAGPANPLTARVMVNRIWQHHFGRGIVRTPGNMGKLGERPTHPELLDFLADQFIRSGWSIKAMHRAVMLSATYQQSSAPAPETLQADPDNRWFGRMNRRRLEAEEVRDALLAVAGRLDPTMCGRASQDFMRPRRTLYLMTLRSDRSTFRELFDAADSTAIIDKRGESTVAPQALFLLNHPFAVQQAKAVAERVRHGAESDTQDIIKRLYVLLYGRAPVAGGRDRSNHPGRSRKERMQVWLERVNCQVLSVMLWKRCLHLRPRRGVKTQPCHESLYQPSRLQWDRGRVAWRFRAASPPVTVRSGLTFTVCHQALPGWQEIWVYREARQSTCFPFEDRGDLRPLQNKRGRLNKRGRWIFYSPQDYYVEEERQVYSGRTDQA